MSEDTTERLLRAAGPRLPVSDARAERVRTTVRAAWQAQHRRQVVRRRLVLTAAAAGAAVLVVAGRGALIDRESARLGAPVAVVERVDGRMTEIQRAHSIRVGQWITTGLGTRLALRFGDECSVRLDVGSRMRALSASAIELTSGAVYVDAGEGPASFEIRTAFGTARDIGTQFEVRIAGESLRLRVRTGIVELRDRTRAISARPGTQVTLSDAGAITEVIAAQGPEWDWIARVAPSLEMDGVTLATFLDRVAREQGWTVEYRDPELARKAQAIVLHGAVDTLTPYDAVKVAVATSGLRQRLEGGSLVVFSQ